MPRRARRASIAVVVAIGGLCLAPSAIAAGFVYWTNETGSPVPSVSFAGLGGSGGGVLDTTGAAPDSDAGGAAIDSATGRIYWADFGSDTISYANLAGGGGGDLEITGTLPDGPYGVAIDPSTNTIYWANYTGATIGYASLSGGPGSLLNTTGATISHPSGMALDLAGGRVYWSNGASNSKPISFAYLNGTGGADLSTAGATADVPNGLAINAATNQVYWANGSANTISYASLAGGGGGQLTTTGATIDGPQGIAIDASAGRLYWGNFGDASIPISFANLNGSGGGDLPNAGPGSMATNAGFPALLETPAAAGAPAIAGSSATGSTLSCSAGTWMPDLPGAFLYRAPESITYSWTLNRSPIGGATSSMIDATSAGSYVCDTTAVNIAGSATQASPAHSVTTPRPPPPPPKKLSAKITRATIDQKHHTARFTFAAKGTSGFQCALTAKPKKGKKQSKPRFSRCASPKTYKHLKAGKYAFAVRALGSAGTGPAASKPFKIA